MVDEDLDLDISWINKYNKGLDENKFLFLENVSYIHIFNIYIENDKIIFYHKYKEDIKNNMISNERILNLLNKFKDIKSKNLKGIVVKGNQNIILDRKDCFKFIDKNKMFLIAK